MPVTLSDQFKRVLDIMLIPVDPGFNFRDAPWKTVSAKYPVLGNDVDGATGEARYNNLMEAKERVVACFLNLSEAMSQISLAQKTPLDYIKQVRWDPPFSPAQDRFFA